MAGCGLPIMVAPVTGPFYSAAGSVGRDWYEKNVYKQKKPFDRPLPYSKNFANVYKLVRGTPYWGIDVDGFYYKSAAPNASRQMDAAVSMCYERLLASIGDRSSMGENLFDLGQSVRTIETRATQMFHIVRDLKKLRLKDVVRDITDPAYSTKGTIGHPIHNASNHWLEYHLGIEPVIKDIHASLMHLQKPIKNVFNRVRAYGGDYVSKQVFNEGYRIREYTYVAKCVAQMQVDVAVSNPYLWLANSLGVINPVQVAWQIVPLSFVLDWFVNVEQFLGTPTDFLGLTLQNAATTRYWIGKSEQTCNSVPPYHDYASQGGAVVGGMVRSLGITLPSLHLRPYKVPGVQRAATAVALLTGGLKDLTKRMSTIQKVPRPPRPDYNWGFDKRL